MSVYEVNYEPRFLVSVVYGIEITKYAEYSCFIFRSFLKTYEMGKLFTLGNMIHFVILFVVYMSCI